MFSLPCGYRAVTVRFPCGFREKKPCGFPAVVPAVMRAVLRVGQGCSLPRRPLWAVGSPPLGRLCGEQPPEALDEVPKRSAERLFTIGAASLVAVPKIPLASHNRLCSTSPRLSFSVLAVSHCMSCEIEGKRLYELNRITAGTNAANYGGGRSRWFVLFAGASECGCPAHRYGDSLGNRQTSPVNEGT